MIDGIDEMLEENRAAYLRARSYDDLLVDLGTTGAVAAVAENEREETE